jgi:hypothetical protein
VNKPELPPLPVANIPANIAEALEAWASGFAIEYAMWYTQELRRQVDVAENNLNRLNQQI